MPQHAFEDSSDEDESIEEPPTKKVAPLGSTRIRRKASRRPVSSFLELRDVKIHCGSLSPQPKSLAMMLNCNGRVFYLSKQPASASAEGTFNQRPQGHAGLIATPIRALRRQVEAEQLIKAKQSRLSDR